MRKLLLITSLFALLAAAPIAAAVFTVTLTSGNTFVTRYQPHQSDSQEDKILLMTEFGNWIFLPKEAVASITSDTESKGFGTVLDSQTISLGSILPRTGAGSKADAEAQLDPTAQLIQFMQQQNAPPPVHTNELVVEPSQSTGIPIGLIRNY